MSASSGPVASDQVTPCEKFYGLITPPFNLTPDLRFAYNSQSHTSALDEVTTALLHREGLVVITGEVGTGKTMLCRSLLEEFHEARTFLSVILDPCLTVDDLLHQVLKDFGLISSIPSDPQAAVRSPQVATTLATRHQLVTALHQFLASLITLNAHAVILIDEAQHLDPAVLEQIRLLSNFETDNAKLLQIVLVGQPDLDAVLARPDMQQLSQRIARRIALHALSETEVAEYITRRLGVASGPPASDGAESSTLPQFTPSALAAVWQISKGIPRIVNVVCNRALEAGCEQQTRTIDRPLVLAAAARLKLPAPEPAKPPAMTMGKAATVAASLLLLGAVGGWLWAACPPQLTPEARQPSASRLERPAGRSRGNAVNERAAGGSPASGNPMGSSGPPGASGESSSQSPRSDPARPSRPDEPPAVHAPANDQPAGRDLDAATPPLTSLRTPALASGAKAERYDILVAAFHTSKRAIEVATDIAAKGFPVTTRADSSGNWYQVVVGPYPSAGDADATLRKLARDGFPDARVSPSVGDR